MISDRASFRRDPGRAFRRTRLTDGAGNVQEPRTRACSSGCDMTGDEDDERPLPEWDTRLAASLIGKYVIAGFIHLEPDGTTVRKRVQVHGVITDAAPETGFILSLRGERAGETMTLPPNPRAFTKASPGRYRLTGTGEVVWDPDYMSLWTVKAQPTLH